MKRGISTSVLALSVLGMASLGLAQAPGTSGTTMIPAGANSLPPNAQPGKCYARVWEDPKYRTVSEQVLRREAAERIELIPAKYEWIEEKVLVRAAYQKGQVVAPKYEKVSEKIMVKPAFTRWKKGRGLIEKVDNFTGEIMCLEEVPAEYKTVTKQVLQSSGTTKTIQVPAEYKTVKVKKLISPAQEKRIAIPAEYDSVTKTVLESDGRMAWREVLCETNAPAGALQAKARGIKAIHAQSKSSAVTDSGKSEKDWFFFWDWDELFEKPNHRFVPASK